MSSQLLAAGFFWRLRWTEKAVKMIENMAINNERAEYQHQWNEVRNRYPLVANAFIKQQSALILTLGGIINILDPSEEGTFRAVIDLVQQPDVTLIPPPAVLECFKRWERDKAAGHPEAGSRLKECLKRSLIPSISSDD